MPAHVHPKNIASAINVLMSLFYPLVFLTDLLEVETESFPRGVSITDESHSQYIPGWGEWWRQISCPVKHDGCTFVVTRVVDQQVIFASLRLKLGKVESDFLVHRNLYLPRAVLVVTVIAGIVCWCHCTTRTIQECSTARFWKQKHFSSFLSFSISRDTHWRSLTEIYLDMVIKVQRKENKD